MKLEKVSILTQAKWLLEKDKTTPSCFTCKHSRGLILKTCGIDDTDISNLENFKCSKWDEFIWLRYMRRNV